MADEKRELTEVAVITPFSDFDGERVESDKRCYDGREPDEKDAEGKVIKKGKAIPTMNKVRLRLPLPVSDEQAQKFYKVNLVTLIGMGVRQRSYTLNKSDVYIGEIGERKIDVAGLTSLVEGDLPIVERAKVMSETKQKAQKYDALRAKFGDDMSDDEIAAAIELARKKKAKASK